jgi:hypothetical protein
MAKKGRNVARKTMSRSDDLLEAAGFLAAPEAQKKRIEDALAEAMTTDPIPRPKMRPKKVMKPKTILRSKKISVSDEPDTPRQLIDDMARDAAANKFAVQNFEEGGEAKMVPKKYKGFSKLPEKVQEKISPDLAEKYEFGGEVKGKKNKGNVCRGGGAALRGTRFSGTK